MEQYTYSAVDKDTITNEDGSVDLEYLDLRGTVGWEFIGIFGEEALFKKKV